MMFKPTPIRLWLAFAVGSSITLTLFGVALVFHPSTFTSIVVVASLIMAIVSWLRYFKHLKGN